MTDDMDPSIFEALEPARRERIDRTFRALVRNFRPVVIKRTITTHNGYVQPTVKFPWGFSWRRVDGVDYCPHCLSASPWSMLGLLMQRSAWNPIASAMEIRNLIDRGEMVEGDDTMHRAMHPPPGYAYATYGVEDGSPRYFTLIDSERGPLTLRMDHAFDLGPRDLAALLMHMNRMSSSIHWSINEDGVLTWANIVPAFIAQPGLDEDDEDEQPSDDSPPTE